MRTCAWKMQLQTPLPGQSSVLKSWITRDTMAHLRHASIVSTRPAGQKGLFAHFWHTLAWVLVQVPKVVPDSQKQIETTATRSMDVDGRIQIISLGDHDIDVRCVPRKTSYTEHVPNASCLHAALKMEQFPRISDSRCLFTSHDQRTSQPSTACEWGELNPTISRTED